MIWFVLLFASLLTGCIYSIILIIKKRELNISFICSILNVILFVIIFAVS